MVSLRKLGVAALTLTSLAAFGCDRDGSRFENRVENESERLYPSGPAAPNAPRVDERKEDNLDKEEGRTRSESESIGTKIDRGAERLENETQRLMRKGADKLE